MNGGLFGGEPAGRCKVEILILGELAMGSISSPTFKQNNFTFLGAAVETTVAFDSDTGLA